MSGVRPITPQDADVYKEVRLRALQDTPSAFGSSYHIESRFDDAEWGERVTRLDGQSAVGFVAMDGDSACGIVGAFRRDGDPSLATLVGMWVAPPRRRSGVGQSLVEAVLEWARGKGVRTIRLRVTSNNEGAFRLYQRLGFEPTGLIEPYPNDPALHSLEMACPVSS